MINKIFQIGILIIAGIYVYEEHYSELWHSSGITYTSLDLCSNRRIAEWKEVGIKEEYSLADLMPPSPTGVREDFDYFASEAEEALQKGEKEKARILMDKAKSMIEVNKAKSMVEYGGIFHKDKTQSEYILVIRENRRGCIRIR